MINYNLIKLDRKYQPIQTNPLFFNFLSMIQL
jgi:hypothetical protein